jgi:hypothetical protein
MPLTLQSVTSRPCNMSVGVPNVHVKVYNMSEQSSMQVWGIDVQNMLTCIKDALTCQNMPT